MPRARLVSALLASLLLVWAGAALAHTSGAPAPAPAGPIPDSGALLLWEAVTPVAEAAPGHPVPAWAVLLLAAPAAALVRRRPFGVVAVGLALVVTVFAFETAFHSVHHGFDGTETTACPTAAAALQVAGTPLASLALEAPLAAPRAAALELEPLALADRPLGPLHGRAPPSARV